MKHNFRDTSGKFTPVKPTNIVPGRLYGYRGTVVRAGKDVQRVRTYPETVKRHVSVHKTLFGFVDETELVNVGARRVAQYLKKADKIS
jgi:hypothetical protein